MGASASSLFVHGSCVSLVLLCDEGLGTAQACIAHLPSLPMGWCCPGTGTSELRNPTQCQYLKSSCLQIALCFCELYCTRLESPSKHILRTASMLISNISHHVCSFCSTRLLPAELPRVAETLQHYFISVIFPS